MSKYIDVKISLEKTIKIDSNSLDDALKIAKDQFSELELTSDWLNAREVTFTENKIIEMSAKKFAELYYNNFDEKDFKELLDILFIDIDIKENIYNETINILKTKYHDNDINIKI